MRSLLLLLLAVGFAHDSSHLLPAVPNLAGRWILDSALTTRHRMDAGRDPAGSGPGSPLGKELLITQNDREASVSYSLAGRRVTMVYRFDGRETRNMTIGRDAPIEERSVAKWEGNTLIVRTTRANGNSAGALPNFVRRWSIQGNVLVIATETDGGPVDTCFSRVADR